MNQNLQGFRTVEELQRFIYCDRCEHIVIELTEIEPSDCLVCSNKLQWFKVDDPDLPPLPTWLQRLGYWVQPREVQLAFIGAPKVPAVELDGGEFIGTRSLGGKAFLSNLIQVDASQSRSTSGSSATLELSPSQGGPSQGKPSAGVSQPSVPCTHPEPGSSESFPIMVDGKDESKKKPSGEYKPSS